MPLGRRYFSNPAILVFSDLLYWHLTLSTGYSLEYSQSNIELELYPPFYDPRDIRTRLSFASMNPSKDFCLQLPVRIAYQETNHRTPYYNSTIMA